MAFPNDERLEVLIKRLLANTKERDANGHPTNQADANARKVCELLIKRMGCGYRDEAPASHRRSDATEDDPLMRLANTLAEPIDDVLHPKARARIRRRRFLDKYGILETRVHAGTGSDICVACGERIWVGDMILRTPSGHLLRSKDRGMTHSRCAEFWVRLHERLGQEAPIWGQRARYRPSAG